MVVFTINGTVYWLTFATIAIGNPWNVVSVYEWIIISPNPIAFSGLCKSGWLAINRFSPKKCHKVHQARRKRCALRGSGASCCRSSPLINVFWQDANLRQISRREAFCEAWKALNRFSAPPRPHWESSWRSPRLRSQLGTLARCLWRLGWGHLRRDPFPTHPSPSAVPSGRAMSAAAHFLNQECLLPER